MMLTYGTFLDKAIDYKKLGKSEITVPIKGLQIVTWILYYVKNNSKFVSYFKEAIPIIK